MTSGTTDLAVCHFVSFEYKNNTKSEHLDGGLRVGHYDRVGVTEVRI